MKLRTLAKILPTPKDKDFEAYGTERKRVFAAHGIFDRTTGYAEFEMESPFIDTSSDRSFTQDSVDLHSHAFFEIIFVQSGNGLQYLLGTDCYAIRPGNIIVIPPGVSHRPLMLERLTEPYSRYVVRASPRMANLLNSMFPNLELLSQEPFVLQTDEETSENLRVLFKHGSDISTKYDDDWWQPLVVGNSISLLAQIMRVKSTGTLARPESREHSVQKTLAFIEAHLAEPITAKDAAEQLKMSESGLGLILRRQMNVSFHKLLTQRRLIAAKHLLLSGETSSRASTLVGFGDYSSFYRAFKREYGISPSEYVKLNEAQ